MEMAKSMDRNGNHFLKDEYYYFDGKVRRCRNFVTLTASVYHPLLKRQVPLAIMDAEKENSENIKLFWTVFNEALRKTAGDPEGSFKPKGWCTDMASANMNGLKNVFGGEVLNRIKSHFKENRNIKALCERTRECNRLIYRMWTGLQAFLFDWIHCQHEFTVSHSKIISASWDLDKSEDPWSGFSQSRTNSSRQSTLTEIVHGVWAAILTSV